MYLYPKTHETCRFNLMFLRQTLGTAILKTADPPVQSHFEACLHTLSITVKPTFFRCCFLVVTSKFYLSEIGPPSNTIGLAISARCFLVIVILNLPR